MIPAIGQTEIRYTVFSLHHLLKNLSSSLVLKSSGLRSNFVCAKKRHDYSKNFVRGQGHSDPKMEHDKSPSKDASIYQIWDFYLK